MGGTRLLLWCSAGCAGKSPSPTEIPPGEAVPANRAAKCGFEGSVKGTFVRADFQCSCLSWPAALQEPGGFCILLKPHSTRLGYMGKEQDRGPLPSAFKALGDTAAMNLIAAVAFPVSATVTVMY